MVAGPRRPDVLRTLKLKEFRKHSSFQHSHDAVNHTDAINCHFHSACVYTYLMSTLCAVYASVHMHYVNYFEWTKKSENSRDGFRSSYTYYFRCLHFSSKTVSVFVLVRLHRFSILLLLRHYAIPSVNRQLWLVAKN